MTKSSFSTAIALLPLLVVASSGQPVWCDDGLARSAMFDEQHVDSSVFSLLRRARELAPDERFRLLSDWVLPGSKHATLRVQVAFTPTNEAPPFAGSLGESSPKSGQRRSSGGRLVSPVLTLIDTAQELGRLNELHGRVATWAARGPMQIRNQTGVLTLIELARGNAKGAEQRFERLAQLRSSGGIQTTDGSSRPVPPSAVELLVLERSIDQPSLRELVTDTLAIYRPWVLSEFSRPIPHRYVAGLLAQLQIPLQAGDDSRQPLRAVSQQPPTQWHSASRSTAKTRGEGQPAADWLWRSGFAGNTASHGDDYLIFNTPLQGNYEVECDVTGFEWRDSSLLVAGTWLAPVYTHQDVDVGSFRSPRPRRRFTPPLTKTKSWIRFRTVVRDGLAATYLNGRRVHTETLPEHPSPWVAVRSTQQHDGAVRDLRITGSPDVPEEIKLSDVDTLNDWVPYFEGIESDVRQPLWYLTPRGGADNEIVGLGKTPGAVILPRAGQRIAGAQESLLRYFRPMVEDGEIEYEFYYVPGQLQAHPALDRLAFLLLPDGVRAHWITDGPYDRTGIAADNVVDEPECRRGPAALPLNTDGWNRLKLALTGDTVSLTLNGQLIYERPIEATNQRTFGLFHFADWSTLLVRRVVWRGDWSRQLPPVGQQELALPDTNFLDESRESLSETFEHDFARDGFSLDRFTIVRGNVETQLRPTSTGLLATREGTGGYQNATVAPAIKIAGDFDIIAEYDQLAAQTVPEGKTMVALLAILDNAVRDESLLARRQHSRSAEKIEQIVHCVAVGQHPEGERRNYLLIEPMEERSGRLRLARRGDQLYYLTAEGDSPNFRLRTQRKIATDPVAIDGLRLLTQIYGDGGQVSVVWKKLSIRAHGISGSGVSEGNAVLAGLNDQRGRLPAQFVHDFRKQAPADEEFRPWGTVSTWEPHSEGWQISAQGTDNWTSSGVAVQKRIEGDFDASLRFAAEALAKPKPGQHSQVYLQAEFSDEDRTTVGAIFTLEPNGDMAALAQVRERKSDGSFNYRVLGQIAVGKVDALRIARRGSSISFLASGPFDREGHVIADYELSDVPIEPGNLRMMLHTGGADRESTARWQSLSIRAERLSNTGTADAKARPAKGVVDSVLDLFR